MKKKTIKKRQKKLKEAFKEIPKKIYIQELINIIWDFLKSCNIKAKVIIPSDVGIKEKYIYGEFELYNIDEFYDTKIGIYFDFEGNIVQLRWNSFGKCEKCWRKKKNIKEGNK